jgi:hypothetical protein
MNNQRRRRGRKKINLKNVLAVPHALEDTYPTILFFMMPKVLINAILLIDSRPEPDSGFWTRRSFKRGDKQTLFCPGIPETKALR